MADEIKDKSFAEETLGISKHGATNATGIHTCTKSRQSLTKGDSMVDIGQKFVVMLAIRSCCVAVLASIAVPPTPARAQSFSVDSVSASPGSVQPGQTVKFATTVTASAAASNYTIGLQVFYGTTFLPAPSTLFKGVNFEANKGVTETAGWTIPTNTPTGTYKLLAGVFDSDWNWRTGQSTYFTVVAASGGVPVSGACGSANGGSLTVAPTGNLCSAGTPSAVSGAGPWSWTCSGSYGGSTAACSASLVRQSINGACGSANGVVADKAPTAGLCSTGIASAVAGSGPWSWSCSGGNGGAPAFCSAPKVAELPGLSPALSASPPYSCVTNYYVDAVNGNDANPGTRTAPWKTIQNADNGWSNRPSAGECVNVRPGTYKIANTIVFGRGGNSNAPTGYVVYRSTVPQAAHIVAAGQLGGSGDMIMLWAPYIVVDGFDIDGNNATTSGAGLDGCADGGGNALIAHHFVAINNIIHDVGGSGLSSCTADFITWEHNVVYNTSSTNLFQVSGLNLWEPKALAPGSYAPTSADEVPFGITIAYNIAYHNGEGPAIPTPHTDGNGIIIDTTLGSSICPTCGTAYPGNILVLGNLAYDNGGGGVHVFLSRNVTVANNTVFNNYLDLLNPATARGELSNGGSQNVTWVNNIAIADRASGVLANNRPIISFPVGGFLDSGTWIKNIAFGAPVISDGTSYVNPATNLIGVNPQLTNPAADNFVPVAGSPALASGQPESYIASSTPDIGAY